jgi:gamma-glutamyltranspeptidase / glutathione hydrolase
MRRIAAIACAAAILFTAPLQAQMVARNGAVVSDSPLATRVATGVLRDGGSAVDAAVAAAFVLFVTHPHAAGIGGGGFLTYYDARSSAVWVLDFRETAPAALDPAELRGDDAQRRRGLWAGAPSAVAGLAEAHRKFGSTPWGDLVRPAQNAAGRGTPVGKDLASALARAATSVASDPRHAVFFPEGRPLPAGAKLVQPDLARTLTRIGKNGASELADGQTAKALVAAVREEGGKLALLDLREYATLWRAPLQVEFGEWTLYTAPPPSGGGLVLAQTLNIAGVASRETGSEFGAKEIHYFAEAERRARVDLNRFAADPSRETIRYGDLLSAARAAAWRETIDAERATPTIGVFRGPETTSHTTHISAVDAAGNAVSMTLSLSGELGAGFVAGSTGVFVNAAVRDFTIEPADRLLAGLHPSEANRAAASKRMVSPLAPTIVLRDGKLFLVAGASGGDAIAGAILRVVVGTTLFGESLAAAVAAPRFHQATNPDVLALESHRIVSFDTEGLREMGHTLDSRDALGVVCAIMVRDGKRIAFVDPRSEGAAGGY